MCRMYNNNSICLHIVTRCIACHVKYSFIVSIVTHVLTLLPLLFFRKASAGLAQQRNKPGARLNARCSSMLRNKNWSVDLWNPFKPRPNPLTSKTIYRNDLLYNWSLDGILFLLRLLFRPGGIPARNHKGERLLLYLGIIDILQSYRMRKKIEHAFKAIIHDGVSTATVTFLQTFGCVLASVLDRHSWKLK